MIWTVTDASGNKTTCTVAVTVNDLELPTLTCPANQVFANDPGQCSKVILTTALDPVFSDNCPDAGISHNPLESTSSHDMDLCVAAFKQLVDGLASA